MTWVAVLTALAFAGTGCSFVIGKHGRHVDLAGAGALTVGTVAMATQTPWPIAPMSALVGAVAVVYAIGAIHGYSEASIDRAARERARREQEEDERAAAGETLIGDGPLLR